MREKAGPHRTGQGIGEKRIQDRRGQGGGRERDRERERERERERGEREGREDNEGEGRCKLNGSDQLRNRKKTGRRQ